MEREHVARVDPDRAKSGGKVTRISMAPPPPPSESEATDQESSWDEHERKRDAKA